MDTRETKHVESNKVGHTEISSKSQCIYLINSTRDEILVSQNISTEDGDSRILILYDVLYAPRIPWNLLFTFAFTGFGFNLSINDNFVNIYWEEVLYRCAQTSIDLYILDTDDTFIIPLRWLFMMMINLLINNNKINNAS